MGGRCAGGGGRRVGFALYWFQPWKLWQDETVQELLKYTVPEDIDPARYRSVSIWCERLDVSLGGAELTRA